MTNKDQAIVLAVDAAMVEMANIHPPLRRSECEQLIRAALKVPPAPDCRTCDYYVKFEGCTRNEKFGRCINGDKYEPAAKVVLWRTE